jgi:hypothetical protein
MRSQRQRIAPWFVNPLRRVEWLLDESQVSRSARAVRVRFIIGSLFLAYGLLLEIITVRRSEVELAPLCFIIGSLPIFLNRLGRLGRYFIPVGLGLYAYAIAASYVVQFKLGVHYTTQIRIDRYFGAGSVPTVWLQQHLYHGNAGALEFFCVIIYLGHFVIPLALGAGLALSDRAREFKVLMFSILAVAVLGAITFVIVPTAPPWLAAQDGYLNGVHHILKQSMSNLHMASLAAQDGDASKYDVTAAVPSLHAAFPVICLVTAVYARLPRAVIVGLALDFLCVVFAIVYTGEHYVFDAIVGTAYALAAVLVVRLALEPEQRAAERSLEVAPDALAPAAGATAGPPLTAGFSPRS